MSSQNSTIVGVIVAVLIIGAVGTLGFYQVEVAGKATSTTNTSTVPQVTCPSSQCIEINMTNGASSPPAGYTSGSKTTYGFGPDTVTLVIGKNNTVLFNNADVAQHTATSDTGAPSSFDSGIMASGATYQVTLSVAGTYTYHCTLHPWMQGTIVVKSS